MRFMRIVLNLMFILGLICCGFYSAVLTILLVLGLSSKNFGGDIPRYPQSNFFGLLILLAVMVLNTSFFFVGKSERFRKIVIWADYVLGLGSLLFIVVGVATKNRFTGDETNIGLVWLTMSAIFRALILLRDMREKRLGVFRDGIEQAQPPKMVTKP